MLVFSSARSTYSSAPRRLDRLDHVFVDHDLKAAALWANVKMELIRRGGCRWLWIGERELRARRIRVRAPQADYWLPFLPDAYFEVIYPKWRRSVRPGRDRYVVLTSRNAAQHRFMVGGRTVAIQDRDGSPETFGDKLLVEWLADQEIALDDSELIEKMLTRRAGEPSTKEMLAALRTEQLLRTTGDGDVELGRQRRAERIRRVTHNSHHKGRSMKAYVATASVDGTFSLCPLCWLVTYRTPAQNTTEHPWHKACWDAWRRRPDYVNKWHERQRAAVNGVSRDMLCADWMPRPPARSGRPPDLATGYQMLMAWKSGLSSAPQLAGRFGITPRAVR